MTRLGWRDSRAAACEVPNSAAGLVDYDQAGGGCADGGENLEAGQPCRSGCWASTRRSGRRRPRRPDRRRRRCPAAVAGRPWSPAAPLALASSGSAWRRSAPPPAPSGRGRRRRAAAAGGPRWSRWPPRCLRTRGRHAGPGPRAARSPPGPGSGAAPGPDLLGQVVEDLGGHRVGGLVGVEPHRHVQLGGAVRHHPGQVVPTRTRPAVPGPETVIAPPPGSRRAAMARPWAGRSSARLRAATVGAAAARASRS